jgi:integrase
MKPLNATSSKRPKTKRRGRGEGSIFLRADGRWAATITVGHNLHGKRIRRTVYAKTKALVQAELLKLQTKSAAGTLPARSDRTVGQYLTFWLENCAKPAVRPSTYIAYSTSVNNHILGAVGGVKLTKLNAAQVQAMDAHLAEKGESPRTRRLALAMLSMALKRAIKLGLLVGNACDAVDPPRVPDSEINPLTPDQVSILLEAVEGDRFEGIYAVALGGGLRIGELLGLQWPCVDLKTGAVVVRYTQTDIKGLVTLTEPKSKSSRRRITLPESVVEILRKHRKKMLAEGHAAAERVFVNDFGAPLRRAQFQLAHFKPLLKRAGLPDFRFHDLRHTHASLLLGDGANIKVIQSRLGHSKIQQTLNCYAHLLPEADADAAASLDKLLTARPAAQRAGAG